ncbi:hypothetical protein AB0P28_05930 [Pseudarthrobacter sp. NPDC089323]
MANLTADRDAMRRDGELISMPVAAVKVFKGSLLANNTSGYATEAADTANFTLAGIAYDQVDNSAGAAGDKSVRVERKGVFELNRNSTNAHVDGEISSHLAARPGPRRPACPHSTPRACCQVPGCP